MAIKTLSFEHAGRSFEIRMEEKDYKSYVAHVWEGGRKVNSVPYSISQAQVEAAEARGDLDQTLDEAMAEVRETVIEGGLKV